MNSFDVIWHGLQSKLKSGTTIKNWTAFSGNLGDTMTIVKIRENYIEVEPPRAMNVQVVSKKDFESVWEVWTDYKTQKVKREELKPMTRYSKYIISIYNWYETHNIFTRLLLFFDWVFSNWSAIIKNRYNQ